MYSIQEILPGISRFCNKGRYFFLTAFIIAIYYPAFSHNFIPDDWYYLGIYQNLDFFQEFVIAYFGGAFSFPLVANGFYRPVYSVFYHFGYQFFGLDPTGYKIIVFVLFISRTILVFNLCDLFFKDQGISFLASVIYLSRGLHDFTLLTANSIGNVSSDFFMLLSLYSFLIFKRDGNASFLILSIVAYCGAFFSKEGSVILVFLILFIEVCYPRTPETNLKSSLKELVPFFLIFSFYVTRIFFIRSRMISAGPYSMSFTLPIVLNNLQFLVLSSFNNSFEMMLFLIFFALMVLSTRNLREDFGKNFLFVGIFLIGFGPYLFLKAHVLNYYSGFSSVGFSAFFAYILLTAIKNELNKKVFLVIFTVVFMVSGFLAFQVYQDMDRPANPYTFQEQKTQNVLHYLRQTNLSYDNATLIFVNSNENLYAALGYGYTIKLTYKNVSGVYFDNIALPGPVNNAPVYYFNYDDKYQNISSVSLQN